MFDIKRIMCNPLQENCYVVSDESNECVIIDCGVLYEEEKKALKTYINEKGLKPVHLLSTHGHLDHNFGTAFVYQEWGLETEICSEDKALLEALPEIANATFHLDVDDDMPPTGRLLEDGDTIVFGSHTLQVMHTPGHSHGSVLYYCKEENTVFTGDTLFRMSIGRTDFAEGSWAEMENSLKNVIANLPKETIVLAGHGPQSTIGDELQYNPYLRR